ncbi:para-aminobenzoate synthetase component 1 [Tamaricihabitans halophyticus]|uniref:Para-aminobenzoate synthetase component 1 n=1 Tax=Tamaricihabitans halophyticus TaxID=1262583 RepID=A0A4R2R406_9PSEU|nr:aminodeoxychorismate synthase component I [Tamaricihabitans halophyticus]TCP56388.1 para-aminobenzoate synthetase component 1 [Tamaricihabitans halophyticus]
MRLVRRLLRNSCTPADALRLLAERANRRGLPAPAALSGEWFGSRAVLAPTLDSQPVDTVAEAFAIPTRQPVVRDAAPGALGGGWFGYLGYGLTDPKPRARVLPPAVWGWADHLLRLDAAGRWWFEALIEDQAYAPAQLADELERLLDEPANPQTWRISALRQPSAARHQQAVRDCQRAISAGELFQANICTRFDGQFHGAPSELFAEATERLRPARAGFLSGSWGSVLSLSPELFLSRHGNVVRSVPIKGTLPRRGPADEGNAELLRASIKDVAENVMIVDLVRNDLGRVCRTGEVWVPELLTVRPAPGVWHLQSTVRGELAPHTDDAELLRATFPPGSVTGAPKVRALELIGELETAPREVYCGAVGLVSPIAGLELNVAIRTFEIHENQLWLGVGGGITADSDPAAEWQECLHKAAPLVP